MYITGICMYITSICMYITGISMYITDVLPKYEGTCHIYYRYLFYLSILFYRYLFKYFLKIFSKEKAMLFIFRKT